MCSSWERVHIRRIFSEETLVLLASDPALAREIASRTPGLGAAVRFFSRNLGIDYQVRRERRVRKVLNARIKTAMPNSRRPLHLKRAGARAQGIVNANLRPAVILRLTPHRRPLGGFAVGVNCW